MLRKRIKHLDNINFNITDFTKLFTGVVLAYTISIAPVYSQQIITDGMTNTQLNANGKVTNVTTSTIKGSNAFNSFSKFNVDSGNTVNLIVPGSSERLINIVKNETTNINGILNSVKNGNIGGNIYLVNPYGVVVGSQGAINVGSLTVVTPTKQFTDNFFSSPGNPDDTSVASLLNGTAPVNTEAVVNVLGKISAKDFVNINAGNIVSSGMIEISDLVNVDKLDSANEIAMTAANNIVLNSGTEIKAKAGQNGNGGDIYIFAHKDAVFNKGGVLDARGGELSGDGGFIEFSANRNVTVAGEFKAYSYNGKTGSILIDPVYRDGAVFAAGDIYTAGANLTITGLSSIIVDSSIISTRKIAGIDHLNDLSTGNSGNLTLTAPDISIINNARIYTFANNGFAQGTININPSGILNIDNSDMITYGSLTLNAGNINANGLIFKPHNIQGGTLISNFLTQNAVFNLSSSNSSVSIGNLDQVYIGGSPLHPIGMSFNINGNVDFSGDITVYGDVNVTSTNGNITRTGDTSFLAAPNINFSAPNGSVGTLGTPFRTDMGAGALTISAHGDVNILERAGGVNINYIVTPGDVNLHAPGSILDARAGEVSPNIQAKNITIISDLGSVGAVGDDFDIDTRYLTTVGKLNITAYNGLVNVSELAGDLDIDSIISNNDVTVLSAGSILDGNTPDTNPNIRGKNITLTAQSGTVGTELEDLDVDTRYATANGKLTVTSYNGVVDISEFSADMEINTIISNQDVYLLAPNNILDGNTPDTTANISGKNITLTSQSGSVGTDSDDLEIDTKYATSDGKLKVVSYNGVINISELSGNLDLDVLISNQNVTLLSPGSILDANTPDTDPNIRARNIVLTAQNGTVGTALDDLDIETKFATADGTITITSYNGLVNISELSSNLDVNSIISNFDVTVLSPGGIIDGSPDDTNPNIRGKNITLTAQNGTVGTLIDDFNVDTKFATTDGKLKVTCYNGLVNVSEFSGNLEVDNVVSNQDVNLVSPGSILDGNTPDTTTNVSGKTISLTALNGTIGTSGDDFNINTKYASTDGELLALSYNGLINLTEISGNLDIESITSKDNVTVVAAGSILDANSGDVNPNIRGKNITLTAQNGTTGTASDELDLDTRYTTSDGKLKITSYNGVINVAEFSGDLEIDSMVSNDNVTILSPGSILDGSALDTVPNVRGKNLTLETQLGAVGSVTDDLDVDTKYATSDGKLTITSYNGLVNISEFTDNLDLNSVISKFDVTIQATGSILDALAGETANVFGKNITLTSTNGSLGTVTDDLNIYTNFLSAGGVLTATALNGPVNMTQFSEDLPLYYALTKQDLVLKSSGNILDLRPGDTTVNAYGKNITLTSTNGSIGTLADDLNILVNYNTSGGVLTASAINGPINLTQYSGDLPVYYALTKQDLVLKSSGNILDLRPGDTTVNAYGKNITLTSTNGSIGTLADDLNIWLNYGSSGGVLTASAINGPINLTQYSGDLPVYYALTKQDLILKSSGNILDARTDETTVNAYGKNITLTSANGSIGTVADDLNIWLNYGSSNGALTASAINGPINLTQYSGDLPVYYALTKQDLILKSSGNILDARTGETTVNAYGKNITLTSTSGSLGTIADDLNICLNYNSSGGVLSASALNGPINISQYSGNLYLNTVTSNQNVTLKSALGIYTNTLLPVLNVSGANLALQGTTAIGTITNPIETHKTGTITVTAPGPNYVHQN